MGTPREALLLAVNNNDKSDLLKILQDQNTKNPSINMTEIFMELSQKQILMFCEILTGTIKNVLSMVAPSVEASKENCELLDITKEVAIQVLLGITSVISTVIQNEKLQVENILAVSILLHDAIDLLPQDANLLKNRISQMCELWWNRGIYDRERIIPKVFSYILKKSLKNSTKSDIKRVNALRDCLTTIHLGSEENEMLVQCATSSAYLQTEHGQKFIAFIMVLSPRHVRFFHNAITMKLTQCTGKDPAHYGEIYRRAWNSVSGNNLKGPLELCIQDIMDHCIHASNTTLFKALKMFLDQLHCPKLHMEFHQMISRLYSPILWRSLKVANYHVRRNAAVLFFAAFPFDAESLVQVEKDSQIQKQLFIAEELIYDTHPSVRASAALGLCTMFCGYWRLIPNNVIRSMLMNLVDDLAFDAASWLVRANVFKGFAVLLKNSLTFELLKEILPILRNCIHDTVELVRVAFMECLLLLKGVKVIKFWGIVPPDELICRLAVDSHAVCVRITKLLLPTYLPFNKGNEKLINRTIALIMTNREASRRFYMHAFTRTTLDLANAVDFIVLVHRLVFEYVKTELKKAVDSNEEVMVDSIENIDLDDANEEELDEIDLPIEVIGGLLDAVSIVLFSINRELSKGPNKPLKKKINFRLSRSMPKFFKVFRETEVFNSVLYLSSLIPASTVQMASSYCMSRLRALPSSSTSDEYIILLESMANWSRAGDVLELISGWLRCGLSTAPTPSKKVQRKRAVNFQEPFVPQPQLALDLISSLMENSLTMKSLLRNNRADMLDLFGQLKQVQKVLEIRVAGNTELHLLASDEFLIRAFLSLCEIAVVLHDVDDQETNNSSCLFSQILEWVENSLFSRVKENTPSEVKIPKVHRISSTENQPHIYETDAEEAPTLAWKIIMSEISASCNILAVVTVDITLAARMANFCGLLLNADVPCQTAEGGQMLMQILYIIHQLEDYSFSNRQENGVISHTTVPRLFSSWLKATVSFSNHFKDNNDDMSKLLPDLRPSLVSFLQTHQKVVSSKSVFLDTVMPTLMAAVLSDVTNSFMKSNMTLQENNTYSFSQLSTLLLSTITSESDLARHFLKELTNCLQTQIIEDCFGLLAALAILSAINKSNKVPAVEETIGILGLEDAIHKCCRKISNCSIENKKVCDVKKIESIQAALQNLKNSANITI